MKFSSTDKRSEPVSLIRNKKKKYFIGKNKCIVKKLECWPVFKQDPVPSGMHEKVSAYSSSKAVKTISVI